MARTTIWEGSLRTSSKPLDDISITSLSPRKPVALPSPPPTSSSSAYLDSQPSLASSQSYGHLAHTTHHSSAKTSSPPVQRPQIRRIRLKLGTFQPAAIKTGAIEAWSDRLSNGDYKGEFVVRENDGHIVNLVDLDPEVLPRTVEEDLRLGFKLRATDPSKPAGLLYFHAALIPEPKAASLSLDTQGRTLQGVLVDFVPFGPDRNQSPLTLLIYGIKSTPPASTFNEDQRRPKKPSLSIFAVQFPNFTIPCSPPSSTAPAESVISSSAPGTPCLSPSVNDQTSASDSVPSQRLRPRGTFSPRHSRFSHAPHPSSTLSNSRELSPIPIVSPAQFSRLSRYDADSSNTPSEVDSASTPRPKSEMDVSDSITSSPQSSSNSNTDDYSPLTDVEKSSFPSSNFTFTAPSSNTANKPVIKLVSRPTTIKRIVLKKTSLYQSSIPEPISAVSQESKVREDQVPSSDSDESSLSDPSSSDKDTEEGSHEESESESKRIEEEEGRVKGKGREMPMSTAQIAKPSSLPPSHHSERTSVPAPPLSPRLSGSNERPRQILPLRKPSQIKAHTRPTHARAGSNVQSKSKAPAPSARPPPPLDVGFSHPFSSDGEAGEGPVKPARSELFKDKVSRGDVLIEQDAADMTAGSVRSTQDMMKRKRKMYERPARRRPKRLRRAVEEEEDDVDNKSSGFSEATPRRRQTSKEALQAGYTSLNKLLLRKSVDEALQAVGFYRSHPEFHTVWAWIVRGCAFSLRETFSSQELEVTDLAQPIQTHIQAYLPSSFRSSQSSSAPQSDVTVSPCSESSLLPQEESERTEEETEDDESRTQGGDLMAFAEIWVAAGEKRDHRSSSVVPASTIERAPEADDTESEPSDCGRSSDLASASSPCSSSSCSASQSSSLSSENEALATPSFQSSASSSESESESESTSETPTLRRPFLMTRSSGPRSTISPHCSPNQIRVPLPVRISASVRPLPGSPLRPASDTTVGSRLKDESALKTTPRMPTHAVVDVIDEDETEDETWF